MTGLLEFPIHYPATIADIVAAGPDLIETEDRLASVFAISPPPSLSVSRYPTVVAKFRCTVAT